MNFGEKLKNLREASGLSQSELAEKSGLSIGSIRNWEQGVRTQPYWPQVQAVAKALGVSCEELKDDLPATPSPSADTDDRSKGKRK